MSALNIGIYTLFLTPGKIGGIETYVYNLLHHLAQSKTEHRFTMFVGPHNHHRFADLDYPNLTRVELPFVPPQAALLPRLLRRLKLKESYVSQQLHRYPLDVIHYPGSTIDQPSLDTPCVLTLHDVQHLYYPQFFPPAELKRRRRDYPASVRRAAQVMTVSEHARQTVLEQYHLPPDRVTAIWHGIQPAYRYPLPADMLTEFRRRYNLPARFLLFPANFWPHKNHQTLFEALAYLAQQHDERYPLVLSGIFANHLDAVRQAIRARELDGQCHVLGYLPADELPALYGNATALVYPSLFEGFGLSVVEAMAVGCPVICTNRTALPEVTAGSALLAEPDNPVQLAGLMRAVWHSEPLRQTLREKGLHRARLFSWAETAGQTIEVYEKAATR